MCLGTGDLIACLYSFVKIALGFRYCCDIVGCTFFVYALLYWLIVGCKRKESYPES